MCAKQGRESRIGDLRARAERAVPTTPSGTTVTAEEALRSVEELRAHQVELELRNEQLQENELRLKEACARYGELFDGAPVGYLTLDWQGVIKEVNLTASKMLGRERARVVGTPLGLYLDGPGNNVLYVHLRKARCADTPQTCQLDLRRPEGTVLSVHVQSIAARSSDSPDHVCRVILSELTERRQVCSPLGDGTRQLEALLDNAPHLMARVDRQHRYVLVNRQYAEAAGVSPERAVGQGCRALRGPLASCEAWHDALSRAFETGAPQRFDLEVVANGRQRHHEVRVLPERAADGHTDTALTVVRDATALRCLRTELSLSQRLGVIGQLAGGIAHDVNNVLMAIAGYATLARMRLPAGDETAQHLKQIEDAVQDAGAITNSVLALTHKLPTAKRPIELRALVERTTRLLRRLLPASVALATDPPGENGPAGVWVFGDRTQLQQVILNLAINARDAMPDGGELRIAVAATGSGEVPAEPRLGRSFGLPGAPIRSRVCSLIASDTGPGIPPDVLPHIFEPRFKTEPASVAAGLGFAVIKEIVDEHGGEIAVESHLGQGTKSTITLPCVAPPALPEPVRETQPAPQGQGELIVVAEDNRQVRQVLTTGLQQLGYEVVQAVDARDLVAQCAHWQARARLVVADVDLPKGSGLDALRSIRRGCPSLPAIVITAKVDFDLEAVADAHTRALRKPFRLSEFVRAVRELLASA
jgi:two-component system cell cycle sensor histidine kinase/response regulator CckA